MGKGGSRGGPSPSRVASATASWWRARPTRRAGATAGMGATGGSWACTSSCWACAPAGRCARWTAARWSVTLAPSAATGPAGGPGPRAGQGGCARMPAPGRFGAVLTAMATPFDDQGRPDLDAAVRLARWLVDNGNDGLVVAGTTGEAPVLTDEEKLDL